MNLNKCFKNNLIILRSKWRVKNENYKINSKWDKNIRTFLHANPCLNGCAYPKMQNSKKSCDECKLTKDKYSMIEKLDSI